MPVVPTSLSREAPPEAEAAAEPTPSPSNQQQLLPPSKVALDSGYLQTPPQNETGKSLRNYIVDSSKTSEKVSARLGQQVAKPGAKRRPYVYEVPDPAQGRPLDQRVWRMVKPRVLPIEYVPSPKSMEMLFLIKNNSYVYSVFEQPEEEIESIKNYGRSSKNDKSSRRSFFKGHGSSI